MRYPVNKFKEDWNITAGYGFGAKTDYGYHDGTDLNKNGGGNIELGEDIFAISNGDLVYWHGAKHPGKNFGYHSVYKITGTWGTRWIHQAHCQEDITPAPKAITENERIAHVGNSGTTYAHIHFAVFKVDPATLRDGIDTIAKTQTELNSWWEDPIAFIEKWMSNAPVNDLQKQLDDMRKQRDDNWNLYQSEKTKNQDLQKITDSLKDKLSQINNISKL